MKAASKLRTGTKREAVLRAFVELGDVGMNCFEAVARCHDYVLRSSISGLQRELGITFSRKFETVGEHGTTCARYWLADADRERAAAMLGEVGA
jgi:hypothetical protein